MYPGSENPNTPQPEPRPALALTVAAVERALTFVAQGRITLETIEADRDRTGHLIIADENPATRKRAASSVAFSHALWNTQVQDYLETIKKLHKADVESIIMQARKFSRTTSFNARQEEERLTQRSSNARAQIPLNYEFGSDDSDEEDIGDGAGGDNGALEDDLMQDVTEQLMDEEAQSEYEEDEDEEELERVKGFGDEYIDYEDGHAPPVGENEYDEDENMKYNQVRTSPIHSN